MRIISKVICTLALLPTPLVGQTKRLWVLRAPGEMVEYDPATFAIKQKVKVPPETLQSPQNLSINHLGQILFVPVVSLPLSDTDVDSPHKAWLWNGQAASPIDLGVKRETGSAGSNQAVTETAPTIDLAANGKHLFWSANQARRLQREEIDLSVTTTWQVWQTDLTGSTREDLASTKLPECRCTTGACEETCPIVVLWDPDSGIERFFFTTQVVTAKDGPAYKASTRYQDGAGKWKAASLAEPLRRILDANADGEVVVEAIPDTGCCGWSNQSNDQTLVRSSDKTRTVFDEQATYKNPDYDVSFYTFNARLSPDGASLAMTIIATAQANRPIQLSEQGQANPEESKQIRKALVDLPAVEVKSLEDSPRRLAFAPHSMLVGWLTEKELLLIENQLLVTYNVGTGSKRKSSIRVDDPARVFLR